MRVSISPQTQHGTQGFTIVELLVAIVIISILVGITITTFTNVQTRATKSALAQSMSDTVKRLELDKVTRGNYSLALANLENSSNPANDNVEYQYTSDGESFCITGTLRSTVNHLSSVSKTISDGPCDGHDGLESTPISSPVVHIAEGSFDQNQPPGGISVPVPIEYDLRPSDYVFILFNARNQTNVSMTTSGGASMPAIYSKSMGNSGYQRHFAFGVSGLSGPQTLTANACWTTQCSYDNVNIRGAYIMYVIRGISANPTVTTTSTDYGVQPPVNSVVAPQAHTLPKGKLAIFSYVYYGNNAPVEADASSPGLNWITDSTAPLSHSGTAIATRHAYTTASTSVQYQMTMPSSGTRYHGSVLFTFK